MGARAYLSAFTAIPGPSRHAERQWSTTVLQMLQEFQIFGTLAAAVPPKSAASGSVTMKHMAQPRRSALVCWCWMVLAVGTWGAPGALFAQHWGQRTVFATFAIPVHVEGPNKGLFVQVVQEAAVLAKLPAVQVEVYAPQRAVRSLATGESDALFPALDIHFESGKPVVRSDDALDCKEDFVFTRKGTPALATVEALRGKRVGITRGYPYSREVTDNTAFVIEEAMSDETNIRKLVAGRIDAFVLDEKTGVKAFEALGLTAEMQYDRRRPVSRQEVYVAFKDSPEGRAMAKQFSDGLRQLKASGRYKTITRGITFGGGCAGR